MKSKAGGSTVIFVLVATAWIVFAIMTVIAIKLELPTETQWMLRGMFYTGGMLAGIALAS